MKYLYSVLLYLTIFHDRDGGEFIHVAMGIYRATISGSVNIHQIIVLVHTTSRITSTPKNYFSETKENFKPFCFSSAVFLFTTDEYQWVIPENIHTLPRVA